MGHPAMSTDPSPDAPTAASRDDPATFAKAVLTIVRARDASAVWFAARQAAETWIGAPFAALYSHRCSHRSTSVSILGARGVSSRFLAEYEQVRAEDVFFQIAVDERRPVNAGLELPRSDWPGTRVGRFLARWDIGPSLQAPVIVGGRLVGMFNLARRRKHGEFSARDCSRFETLCEALAGTRVFAAGATDTIAPGLVGRLGEVAALVRRGFTRKMIARHLGVSEETVKTHLARLYRAEGVASKAEYVARLPLPM